jgi:hypothetical protein
MAHIRHGLPWRREEEATVIDMYAQGKDIRDIARLVGRANDAVVHKLIQIGSIGFHEDRIPARRGIPWSNGEIQRLQHEFSSGKTLTEIASSHQREKNAILHRLIQQSLFDYTDKKEIKKICLNQSGSVPGGSFGYEPGIRTGSAAYPGGETMTDKRETDGDFDPFKQKVGFWDRIFHNTDAIYLKKVIKGELDQRWNTFDASIEKLGQEYEVFKKHHMEITEEEENLEITKEEWDESLKSLGNLLNKNTSHEKQMWGITQESSRTGDVKIKQKFKDSDVDEIRFNNMMDYIKQYPELQSKSTINRLLDDVKEKRAEVMDASKRYHANIKEANVYLNTAKKKLQKVEDELEAFEQMKKEGEEKVNNANENDGFGRIRKVLDVITFKTEAEKQYARLNFYEYDRKINTSKNQLKLIKDDIKEWLCRNPLTGTS